MYLPFFALLAATAVASAEPCNTDSSGYCTNKVVRQIISYGRTTKVRINAALGTVVSLTFPDSVELRGEPALGNAAVFSYETHKDQVPFRILIWPILPPNASSSLTAEEMFGESTNLEIFLDSGLTVIVELKHAPRNKSVQSLVFDFPERAEESQFLREKMDDFARRLETEYQSKEQALAGLVEEKARRRLARAMLDRMHCTELSERSMNGLLVIRVRQLCQLGDMLFVTFSIKNRAKSLFHLDRVEIAVAGGEEGPAIEPQVEFDGSTTLPFDQLVRGVAVFTIDESSAREHSLKVFEDGGKQRVVEVDDLEF